MKFNKTISLERCLISSALINGDDHLAYEVANGLDESLFSGRRIGIVKLINAKRAVNMPYAAITQVLKAQAQEDKMLYEEMCDIFITGALWDDEAFRHIKRELVSEIKMQNAYKRLAV
ncbi:hypothetical protein [Campylobacter sp.]|uniref:hypothetical protein n=1 Tax=Campylobacter sp. TaxID=205 RepID=UPI00290D6FC9|nr:hypothetical protein [Campylobacter sp.]MDU6827773.1 hypothetical protein [Campylobacter sp.]